MEGEHKSNGATVGLIIILLILIVGGIYTWKSKLKNIANRDQVLSPITVEDSEELEAILKDLGTADAEGSFETEEIQ